MKQERRVVLSLVAMGRISVAEAERLMAAWSAEREGFWVTAACVMVCGIQLVLHGLGPATGSLAHALAPAWSAALHHAAELAKGIGGLR